ncbi:hypothetical protein VTN96DRAFT_6488 [Rasamsonia emersonii]
MDRRRIKLVPGGTVRKRCRVGQRDEGWAAAIMRMTAMHVSCVRHKRGAGQSQELHVIMHEVWANHMWQNPGMMPAYVSETYARKYCDTAQAVVASHAAWDSSKETEIGNRGPIVHTPLESIGLLYNYWRQLHQGVLWSLCHSSPQWSLKSS